MVKDWLIHGYILYMFNHGIPSYLFRYYTNKTIVLQQ